ncbi:unnamed protein product [Adineta ricciae]|uniref:RING-type domain-containing protein n=1 Tax=Adineta ricciae TaxID=249248 RepID=A0A815WB18_ADIRI|nr:unnamed protein product [Adineta ricciae]
MGIDVDRIVNSNGNSTDLITCSICHDILWKPCTCEICENSFCDDCISLWLEKHPNVCPNNCEYKQRQRLPLILVQLLSKLKILCKNQQTGCQDILSYESLEQHECQCDFQIEQCIGCSKAMPKKERNIHEPLCEQVELQCHVCQGKYKRMNGHDQIECLQNCLIEQQIKIQLLEDKDKQQQIRLEQLETRLTTFENLNNRRIIQFDDVFESNREHIKTNGNIDFNYANFIWENFIYRHISSAIYEDGCMMNSNSSNQNGYLRVNAFTQGQEYVLSSNSMASPYQYSYSFPQLGSSYPTITSSNGTFDIHSIDISTIIPSSQILVTGLKDDCELYTKTIFLTNNSTRIVLEWLNIDKLSFRLAHPSGNTQMFLSRLILT